MPDPKKCCILGVCCPPGGDAQRADLEQWLTAKLADFDSTREDVSYAETAQSWVAELYEDATAG